MIKSIHFPWVVGILLLFASSSCQLFILEELNRSEKDKVKKYIKDETFVITHIEELKQERLGWNFPLTTLIDTVYDLTGSFTFGRDRKLRYDPVTFTAQDGSIHQVHWELYDEDAEDDEPRLFFHADEALGIWADNPFNIAQTYAASDGLDIDAYGEKEFKLSQFFENSYGIRSLKITLTLQE